MTRLAWLAAVVLAAASAGACAPAGTATVSPAATVATSPAASPASPDPTGPPDGGAGLIAPPPASLAIPGAGAVAGDVGSFSWGQFASDGPWVVERTGTPVGMGEVLTLTVQGMTPDRWRAVWAPIESGRAGTGIDGGSASNRAPITVTTPNVQAAWSLRIEASFGLQRRAVWYWRLEVHP